MTYYGGREMAAAFRTVRNNTIKLADETMKKKRIRHLPVVEEGSLVGILSQRDLYHAALSTALHFGEKAQQGFLKTVTVKEVMTEEVVTIDGDTDVKAAARLLIERRIGCLPIVEKGRLVGIVSETDLLRILAS